jgi:hypothetical protein
MRTLSTWMLGGALAASLTWNATLFRRGPPSPSETRGSAESCALAAGELGLDAERARRLGELCARSCGESDRLERRADELQRALLAGLSAPEVDAAATTRLVDEVSELRRRSLASCVEGILGVRELLSAEEVRAFLARCEHGGATCR